MVKGKIIEYLNSLSSIEFENLEYFLCSPVFVKSLTAKRFYSFVKKIKKEKKSFEFTWKDISEYVYKGEKFNENRVMKLTSDFCKVIERYFEYLIFNTDIKYKKNALLRALRERNLIKQFDREFSKVNFKDINLTADDFYYGYSNNLEKCLINKKLDLSDLEKNFFYIFIFVKLEHLINAKLIHSNESIHLEDEILTFLKKKEADLNKEFPAIYYRWVIYKMLEDSNPAKYFYELKHFIDKNDKKFDLNILDYFCDKLLFVCGKNNNSKVFNKEEFIIHKKLEKKGVYKTRKIGGKSFLNTIECALRVNEQNWAEKFINNYEECIDENKQDILSKAHALLEI